MGAEGGVRRERGAGRSGLTLLELLLVLLVVALLFGTSLGAFAALDPGRRQALGTLQGVLRSARNTAVASRAPARVRIDREAGWLLPLALRVVGTWEFEGRAVEGAFGLDGRAARELFVEDGWIGDALSFAGRYGHEVEIPVQRDPAHDFTHGFAIDCAVRRELAGGGRILAVGAAVWLDATSAGHLRAGFTSAAEQADGARPGPRVVLESRAGTLVTGRWTRLRLRYDRRAFVLEVDGVPAARLEETAPVLAIDAPLVLSDGQRPFPGSLDSLVTQAVLAGEPVRLPEGAALLEAPPEVHFAPGGTLDRAAHPEPARLVLGFEDGAREELVVGAFGTMETVEPRERGGR